MVADRSNLARFSAACFAGAVLGGAVLGGAAWAQPVSPCAGASPLGVWTHAGGDSARSGISRMPLPCIDAPRWTRTTDDIGRPISFVAQATPVVASGKVFALGNAGGDTYLFAFDREDGDCVWHSEVHRISTSLASQSSPVISMRHGIVIVPNGRYLTAVRIDNGQQVWEREISPTRQIVNASPCVTDDLGRANRVFITDFDGFGTSAHLHCINLDEFDPDVNAYDPGEEVWSVGIGGSSGNSPAYLPRRKGGLGHVYACSIGDFGGLPGLLTSYLADAIVPPIPLWLYINPQPVGFFGGVSVRGGEHPELFAGSYEFSGGTSSANLVRVDAFSGVELGTAPSNRTSSTPVLLPDGRVLLAGGINGFGTVPTIGGFDLSTGLTPLWDTQAAWFDADSSGTQDPGEEVSIGGWTHQPAAGVFAGKCVLAGGSIGLGSTNAPANGISLVDVDAAVSSPGFVLDHAFGAGGSMALAGGEMFSVGASGLCAFGIAPSGYDVNDDKRVTTDDLASWEQGAGTRDVDNDGSVTPMDRGELVTLLRREECVQLMEMRR